MNSLGTSTIILLSEVNVLFLVAAGIVTAIYFSRRQRDNDALNRLAARLKDEYPARLEALGERIRAGGNRTGEDADRTARQLIRKEYALYKTFMDIYASRNSADVHALDAAVSDVVAGYRELLGGASGGPSGAATQKARQPGFENEALDEAPEHTGQDPDFTDTPPEGSVTVENEALDTQDTPAPKSDGETDTETPAMSGNPEEPGTERHDPETQKPVAGDNAADSDDFDDALESLNLDEIDLGLDEPSQGTG